MKMPNDMEKQKFSFSDISPALCFSIQKTVIEIIAEIKLYLEFSTITSSALHDALDDFYRSLDYLYKLVHQQKLANPGEDNNFSLKKNKAATFFQKVEKHRTQTKNQLEQTSDKVERQKLQKHLDYLKELEQVEESKTASEALSKAVTKETSGVVNLPFTGYDSEETFCNSLLESINACFRKLNLCPENIEFKQEGIDEFKKIDLDKFKKLKAEWAKKLSAPKKNLETLQDIIYHNLLNNTNFLRIKPLLQKMQILTLLKFDYECKKFIYFLETAFLSFQPNLLNSAFIQYQREQNYSSENNLMQQYQALPTKYAYATEAAKTILQSNHKLKSLQAIKMLEPERMATQALFKAFEVKHKIPQEFFSHFSVQFFEDFWVQFFFENNQYSDKNSYNSLEIRAAKTSELLNLKNLDIIRAAKAWDRRYATASIVRLYAEEVFKVMHSPNFFLKDSQPATELHLLIQLLKLYELTYLTNGCIHVAKIDGVQPYLSKIRTHTKALKLACQRFINSNEYKILFSRKIFDLKKMEEHVIAIMRAGSDLEATTENLVEGCEKITSNERLSLLTTFDQAWWGTSTSSAKKISQPLKEISATKQSKDEGGTEEVKISRIRSDSVPPGLSPPVPPARVPEDSYKDEDEVKTQPLRTRSFSLSSR